MKINYKELHKIEIITIYCYLFISTAFTLFQYTPYNYFDRVMYIFLNPTFLVVTLLPSFIAYSYILITNSKNNYALIVRYNNKFDAIYKTIFTVIKKELILFIELVLTMFIVNNIIGNFELYDIVQNVLNIIYIAIRLLLLIVTLTFINCYIIFNYQKELTILVSFIILLIIFYFYSNNVILNFLAPSSHLYFDFNINNINQLKTYIFDFSYYFSLIGLTCILINNDKRNIRIEDF